jgi:hypothetical protein
VGGLHDAMERLYAMIGKDGQPPQNANLA